MPQDYLHKIDELCGALTHLTLTTPRRLKNSVSNRESFNKKYFHCKFSFKLPPFKKNVKSNVQRMKYIKKYTWYNILERNSQATLLPK